MDQSAHTSAPSVTRLTVPLAGRSAPANRYRLARKAIASVLIAAITTTTGCGTAKNVQKAEGAVEAYFSGDYGSAQRELTPLAKNTDENFVLNNLRLGSAAIVRYDLDTAESALLRAYEVLNSYGVNNGGRTLGAVLVDEKIKIWRGEPYERAMANFYLGLTYYIQHDYDNARAAFENALFKLREYTSDDAKKDDYKEQESNFTIATLMLGRCWQKLGRDDLAKANFDRVAELKPELSGVADYSRNERANLILVVDFGYGPRKATDFDGSIIRLTPSPAEAGAVPHPVVRLDNFVLDLGNVTNPPIDLVAMANDRKWQSIDTIRAVKSGIGTGLIAGGAGYGIYRGAKNGKVRGDDVAIAGSLIAAGLLLKATSQADLRHWEMLPRTTFILPLYVEPGKHDISVDFPDARNLHQSWTNLIVPDKGEATYYIRMQRWNPGPYNWPPQNVVPVETIGIK